MKEIKTKLVELDLTDVLKLRLNEFPNENQNEISNRLQNMLRKYEFWTIHENNEPVGYSIGEIQKDGSDFYLTWIHVKENKRRKGLGSLLIKEQIEFRLLAQKWPGISKYLPNYVYYQIIHMCQQFDRRSKIR